MEWKAVKGGLNLETSTDGEYTLYRFKTDDRCGPSKSGKTTTIASSKGNAQIPGTCIKVGFNAYIKPEDDVAAIPPMKVRK
jgi:hypothetical protein